jgi:branched-subunit amino acid transport protein
MTNLDVVLATLMIILATFISRCGLLLLGQRVTIPPRVQEALRFAPACALVALIAPDVLMNQGQVIVSIANPKLLGCAAAVAYFMWGRDMLETILVGMAVFTALRFVFA